MIKRFLAGTSFMAVFGIVDNLGLFVGMAAIEKWIMGMGFDAQVAAGIGNTFSDAIGVLFGGMISAGLYKLLKVNKAGSLAQNLVGIIVGCMIPVVIKIIIAIL